MIAVTWAGFEVTAGRLTLGAFTGLTYALLAAGLVLVYRSSRFINFAHGAIGVFGAAFVSLTANEYGLPYWPAFAFGLLVAAGVGLVTEAAVVRPLADAPKVLSMVVTLGLSTFLIVTALAVNPDGLSGLAFPKPTGMPTGEIDSLEITPALAAQGLLSPLLLLALGAALRYSRLGLAIRAAAANPDAAATAGISPRAATRAAWAIAGAVAAFAATLIIPTRGTITPESLGPELLLRGLAAAAIARFTSFPVAAVTAVVIGVVEQVMASNTDANGLIEVVILVAVIASLLLDRRRGREPNEPWTRLAGSHRPPAAYERVWLIRNLGWVVAAVAFGLAVVIPVVANASQSLQASIVVAMAIVGLSVGVVTGLGGQLSLAQFGFAAVGAAVSVKVGEQVGDAGSVGGFVVGLVAGAAAAGVVALLLAIPALRVRGPQLGVATLSFSLVTSSYLLDRDWLLGERPAARRPDVSVNGISTADSRGYFWVALLALAVTLALVAALRRSSFARALVAVRDNEDGARAMGVRSTQLKLTAATIAGAIAGVGGVVYGHAFSQLAATDYPVTRSIDAITVTVIGGLNSVVGPIIGSVYLLGSSLLSPTTEALAGIAGAWLILVVYQHGGVAGLLGPVVARVHDVIARRAGIDTAAVRAGDTAPSAALDTATPPRVEPQPLVLDAVTRRFGGVVAVDGVSLVIQPGELVGLIGPNGAGKTTLFEIISGFTRPSRGAVRLGDRDITSLPSHGRARLGIARSFQSATLFPTLTVREAVLVACDDEPTADATLARFGLVGHTDAVIGTLPTGLRRLAELACSVASKPQILLLDEPSAGIAQADTEALGRVIADLHATTGMTIVIIEHDLPLLAGLCSRIIALDLGKVVADGTPAEVQADPHVVAAYLGDDAVAIGRTGTTTA